MSDNKLHYDVADLEYKVSFHGLHEWYKSMFEKLGWMVLATRDGREHKIMQYKEGVQHLHEAIAEKIAYVAGGKGTAKRIVEALQHEPPKRPQQSQPKTASKPIPKAPPKAAPTILERIGKFAVFIV